ncbi:polysaccharide deacetylase family protein [Flavobacterium sp. GT3R68]|uniref:polysaccharide deacetylase family protein n=1 Tax=Flavobacterium sp. GT3R68 TaxID=2594437 RepID=UPI000F865D81|nr:polysaccharide deacetylase family protein [Flavobacterium sp. GT3R68]RTY90050.1 polysaccharide deacetylase family protein [Flavobacterium sp. GSN2]TRW93373.1 polysaccharide deacetylase family protein [Flavobacterium sp. GT3R68]
MFYWIKTNALVKKLLFRYVWDIPNDEKTVYLTFDDGPTPQVTEWVLSQLKKYQAEATFFCIGNNIEKYPDIYSKIIVDGHSIGNHTFDHLNGWKTSKTQYLDNVALCEKKIQKYENTSENNDGAKLFRPPYGRTKPSQAKVLREKGYQIIMWDVLSADFDRTISPKQCLENVLKHVQSGSIIVFHDSVKAFPNLEYTLPRTLEFLSKNKYNCKAIRL